MPDTLLKKSPESLSFKEAQQHFRTLERLRSLAPVSAPQSNLPRPLRALPPVPRPSTTKTLKSSAVADGSLPGPSSIAMGRSSGPKPPSISERVAQLEKALPATLPALSKQDEKQGSQPCETPASSSSKRGGGSIKRYRSSSAVLRNYLKGNNKSSSGQIFEISTPAIHHVAPSSSTAISPDDVHIIALAGQLKDFRNTEHKVSQYAADAIVILTNTQIILPKKGRLYRIKPDYDLLGSAIAHCEVIAKGGDFWADEISNEIANGSQKSILPIAAHKILQSIYGRIAACHRTEARFYSMVWLTLQMKAIQIVVDNFTETDKKSDLKGMLSQIALRCTRLPLPIAACVSILETHLSDEQTKNEMRDLGAGSLLTRLNSMNEAINNQKIRLSSDITEAVKSIISILHKSTKEKDITPCSSVSFAKAICHQNDGRDLARLPYGLRPSFAAKSPSAEQLPLPLGRRPKVPGFSMASRSAPLLFPLDSTTILPNGSSSLASSSSDVSSPKPASY